MTLACEDVNSIHVEVFSVDAEKHIDNSLVQTWKLNFGHKAKILFRLGAQRLVKILKMKLRRDFEIEVYSVFCC